jgi:hypothetical protein
MKIARKRPAGVKCPVQVTENKYEMWYQKPILLGTIERDGKNWLTEDGMRFNSSLDALDYLIKIRETIASDSEKKVDEKFRERVESRSATSQLETEFMTRSAFKRVPVPTTNRSTAIDRRIAASTRDLADPEMYEKFQEFMAFQSMQNIQKSAPSKGRSRKK